MVDNMNSIQWGNVPIWVWIVVGVWLSSIIYQIFSEQYNEYSNKIHKLEKRFWKKHQLKVDITLAGEVIIDDGDMKKPVTVIILSLPADQNMKIAYHKILKYYLSQKELIDKLNSDDEIAIQMIKSNSQWIKWLKDPSERVQRFIKLRYEL